MTGYHNSENEYFETALKKKKKNPKKTTKQPHQTPLPYFTTVFLLQLAVTENLDLEKLLFYLKPHLYTFQM